MKAVLLSVLISCAIAPQTLAQQIPKTAISAKPNSSKTAQKKTAPTKSWSRQTLRVSMPSTATQFKFSRDGKTLFTNGANQQSAELWSLTSGKRLSAMKAKPGFAFCDVALSPDGQFAAGLMYSGDASTSTKRNIELLVWNLKTGQTRWTSPIQDHTIQTTESIFCQVEFSPNSSLLATSITSIDSKLQSGVRIWNVKKGTLQQVAPRAIAFNRSHFAFSPDSSMLGVVTLVNNISQLHLWNFYTRKLQSKLQPKLPAGYESNLLWILDIVFSPDQQDVMAFTQDRELMSYIARWQIKTGKLQSLSELPIDRRGGLFAMSPDSQTFVHGGHGVGYHISNVQTNKNWKLTHGLSVNPMNELTRVVFSPDGQQMAIANNEEINIIH